MATKTRRHPDPILTSSPSPPPNPTTPNDRHLDYETIATLPLSSVDLLVPRSDGRRSVSPPPPHVTQPTQPVRRRPVISSQSSTPVRTVERVPDSSPTQVAFVPDSPLLRRPAPHREPRGPGSNKFVPRHPPKPSTFASLMAPPGTQFRPPAKYNQQLSDDEDELSQALPVKPQRKPRLDSSEDELSITRSNIPQSVFTNGRKQFVHGQSSASASLSLDLSQFAYDPNRTAKPHKRNLSFRDDEQPAKKLKQHGPSRALPVGNDLSLDDILDRDIRSKVQRLHGYFPATRIMDLKSQLMLNRGNFEKTFDWFNDLTRGSDSESGSEDEPVVLNRAQIKAAPRVTAKRQLTNKKTIQEKWSSTQRPAEEDAEVKKPRRRLVQGTRHRSESAGPEETAPKQVVEIESDDEPAAEKSDYDDFQTAKTAAQLNAYLLKFINRCSKDELLDVSNQTDEVIDEVLSHRPFQSITAVRSIVIESTTTAKNGRQRKAQKKVGDRLVQSCLEVLESYQAVDKLVAECEKLGKPLQDAMLRWGFDAAGAKEMGEMTFVGTDSPRDSGVGTPSPDASQDDDIVPNRRRLAKQREGWISQPSIMSTNLKMKDYQVVGLNWLNLLWKEQLSGILADEMGLGKTCQVIAFLSHLRQVHTRGVSVVIVPGSTLENWLREFQNFSPELRVEPYYGSQNERPELRENIRQNIRSIDVIVTTYDTAWKQPDNAFLRKLDINVAVFDEGHYLKNKKSQRHTYLMRIAIQAECRLLLTGTPLQNNLAELASILSFMMPEVFSRHEEALESIFKYKAKTKDADHKALLSNQRILRARAMMSPFILRRKKAQVMKDMPKKTARVVYCDLSERQREIYNELLEKEKQAILARQRGEKAENLSLMSELRKASIHPLLFRRIYNERMLRRMSRDAVKEDAFINSDVDLVYEDMEYYSDFNLNRLCEDHPTHLGKYALQHDEWLDSGKVAVLCDLLRTFDANGDRTLLFSQYTMMMDILERVLDHLNLPYCRIDGGTDIADRQALIDEFTTDPSLKVFMLSTKAGGTGINLAAANKVVIFDMSFNPQEDVQAENRAHRVGQTREVEVIRLVSKGTIEEKILGLGSSKLALDERVAGLVGDGEKDRGGEEVEKEGAEMVEELLAEELGLGEAPLVTDGDDLKEGLLQGLKNAGLDVSAA